MQLRILLHLSLVTSVAVILIAWNQVGAPKIIRLEVDGATILRETRQVQVGGILKEAGIILGPLDQVDPPLNAALNHGESLRVTRSISVSLTHNDAAVERVTTALTVHDLLREAAITVGPHDFVALSGKPASLETSLRRKPSGGQEQGRDAADPPAIAARQADQTPLSLEVRHTLPVYVHDRGFVIEVHSLRLTLQDSLNAAGIGLKPGDISVPPLAEAPRAGLHVYITRAKEVRLRADGAERTLRTTASNVKEALQAAGVQFASGDRVEPALETPLRSAIAITVIRVNEERATLEEVIPYATEYVPDKTIEIGERRLAQEGVLGLRKRQVHMLYEDGREVRRTIEKEWIEASPQQAVVHYGTKITLRTLDTPAGPLQYWRKLRVYATWYTPASAGKPPGSPGYGITSLGLEARRGVIAVDPRVIPYRTQIYVPEYGVGIAADTGGGIRGNMIDLAYGDDEEHDWTSRWVEVYLLGPGPDPSEISPSSF